jgi:hypothetical protein
MTSMPRPPQPCTPHRRRRSAGSSSEVAGLGAAPQLDLAGGVASTAGSTTRLYSGACPAITQAPEIIFGHGHIHHVTLSAPSGGWTTMIGGGSRTSGPAIRSLLPRAVPTTGRRPRTAPVR